MSTDHTIDEILAVAARAGLQLHLLNRVSDTTYTAYFWRKLPGGGSGFYGGGDGPTIKAALIAGIEVAQKDVRRGGKVDFPMKPIKLAPAEPWDDPAQNSDPDEDIFG